MIKVGFIGTGNMGGALARAVAKADSAAYANNSSAANAGGTERRYRLMLTNRTPVKAEKLAKELADEFCADAEAVCDNASIAAEADFIFLGVKPQMMEEMLKEIAPLLSARKEQGEGFTLVTMAAGLSIDRIKEMAGGNYQVIRIMPNTPASIGEGMVLYCADDAEEGAAEEFRLMLRAAGRLSRLPEKLIDAGSAVSGCGPAFVYMFIEALADGGVEAGLPRDKAYELAAQMTRGAAGMVLETGRHPGELKDAVCSPGGTTIEGVRVLEEGGLRGLVMDAVIAAYEKNAALG